MDAAHEAWIARCAAAGCRASRWLSATSLVVAALALCLLHVGGTARGGRLAALVLVAAAGAAQAYLAVRIEVDRRIFEILAGQPSVDEALRGFDGAMLALGLLNEGKAGRAIDERARGALSLVKRAGWILAAQLALGLAAPWLP